MLCILWRGLRLKRCRHAHADSVSEAKTLTTSSFSSPHHRLFHSPHFQNPSSILGSSLCNLRTSPPNRVHLLPLSPKSAVPKSTRALSWISVTLADSHARHLRRVSLNQSPILTNFSITWRVEARQRRLRRVRFQRRRLNSSLTM